MVTHEDTFSGVEIGNYDDSIELSKDLKKFVGDNIFFFCVGTDRMTGDSVAPFIGTFLKENGYENVLGTIDDPVHAVNLEEKIKEIPNDMTVLAIDACLGKSQNVGRLILKSGSLHAGAGVGKELPKVGDYHVQAIVNIDGKESSLNMSILQVTRLKVVLDMAKKITKAIELAYPLNVISFEEEITYEIK
ncbi:spore protease YyaC [Bacillus sp. S13(2024)]|uniref:spore protease YyaC n=1 Tax=Bacillus sp. S13(2024) TaxID=3162885 RepID=UPI003D1B97EA